MWEIYSERIQFSITESPCFGKCGTTLWTGGTGALYRSVACGTAYSASPVSTPVSTLPEEEEKLSLFKRTISALTSVSRSSVVQEFRRRRGGLRLGPCRGVLPACSALLRKPSGRGLVHVMRGMRSR